MSPELEAILRRGTLKHVQTLAAAGLGMIVLGLIIGPTVVAVGTTPLLTRIVGMLVLGGGLIAIGVPFLIWAGVVYYRDTFVTALQARSADEIVWLYFVDPPARDRTRTCQVVLGFSDGETLRLATPVDAAERAFAALQDYAPHATVGWSDALQAQFTEAPASLRAA